MPTAGKTAIAAAIATRATKMSSLRSMFQLHSMLKDQLQAELQLPHIDSAARIVDRTEGPRTRDWATRCGYGVAGQRDIWIAKIGMVQDIESLESKIQTLLLGEAEALVERKIEAENPGTCDDVTPQVSIAPQRLQREGLKVEPL